MRRLELHAQTHVRPTKARIVPGGKLEGYKSTIPRITDETLLEIKAKQPVFLVVGFDGRARAIAEVIGLAEP